MSKHCHEMIAKVAKEFAGVYHEENATDNDMFYKFYPDQKLFVEQNWPKFVPHARSTLVTMLSGNYSEVMKEEIADALAKDASIPKSRRL